MLLSVATFRSMQANYLGILLEFISQQTHQEIYDPFYTQRHTYLNFSNSPRAIPKQVYLNTDQEDGVWRGRGLSQGLTVRSLLLPMSMMVMLGLACCRASSSQLARWLKVSRLQFYFIGV